MKVKTYCVTHIPTGAVYFFRALNKPKKAALKRALKINEKDVVIITRIKVLDFISKF